jgi:hypothetical protein
MTILEQLATSSKPRLRALIAARWRPISEQRVAAPWGRKGTSWGKEGEFHKNR